MAITRTPMIDDDGSGTTGTILNNAWKQEFYNQIDGVGTWITITSTPGMFHGNGGMTWNVPAAALTYTLIGPTCLFDFEINSSTVNAPAGTQLLIDLPVIPQVNMTGTSCRALLNGVWEVITCQVNAGTAQIQLSRNSGAVFTLGGVAVQGQMFFRV